MTYEDAVPAMIHHSYVSWRDWKSETVLDGFQIVEIKTNMSRHAYDFGESPKQRYFAKLKNARGHVIECELSYVELTKDNKNLSTKSESEYIAEVAKLQAQGHYKYCPRCGENLKSPELHKNALSRRADIYICDFCGCIEALIDADGRADGVGYWACFNK